MSKVLLQGDKWTLCPLQGYLTHMEHPPPWDPTIGLSPDLACQVLLLVPSSSLLLSSLELSDITIYEPEIRAFLGTAPHLC